MLNQSDKNAIQGADWRCAPQPLRFYSREKIAGKMTAAGAAYQISVGGFGRAEMWLYVDSDEKCVRVQELLRPFAQGEEWHELKGGDVPTCYADFSDGLIVWIKVKEFE